jgi:hypothetical protein
MARYGEQRRGTGARTASRGRAATCQKVQAHEVLSEGVCVTQTPSGSDEVKVYGLHIRLDVLAGPVLSEGASMVKVPSAGGLRETTVLQLRCARPALSFMGYNVGRICKSSDTSGNARGAADR